MSIPPPKKENKRQLREGDRIADFTVVKTLGHGGYGDIYLVKSRLHPDYLTRFAMKIEYPNKDNPPSRNNNANLKNQNNSNQNNSNQNDNNNNNKSKNKASDNKNSDNDNDNNQKENSENANNNNDKKSSTENNNNNQGNEGDNKENNKNDENAKTKNKNRSLLRKSHLYIERSVLNAVQDSRYFPRYISFGQTSLFRFLVMECFGPSLSTIRHVLPTGKYSLSSSLRIGIQMLRAIHSFHAHGFVHRDIKPSNFLIAASLSHPIILIDFGLARAINTEKDKIKANHSGEIGLTNSNINLSAVSSDQINSSNQNLLQNQNQNQNKQKFGFAGTTKYASINAHENKELGRRDDMFSWFYSLIELAAGSLPWSSLREKDEIYQEKKNANMDEFIISHSLPKQLCSIRILLESYSRTDEPDYDLIESFLDEAMRQKGSSWDDKYEWQRIDEESLRDLSSISLKPPKGDKFIPNRRLPPPVLPTKRKSRRHNYEFSDEDIESAEIEMISTKSKQRRHTSAITFENVSKRDRYKSSMVNEHKKQTNLVHYALQVDNQGKYSYFNSTEDKERYGHFGSEQLFSNSSGHLPSYQSSKKVSASPITQSNKQNNNNNNNTTINEKNNSGNRRKYVKTIKRHKNQRKRRNSDPRQPPQMPKHASSTTIKGEADQPDQENDENNNNEKGQDKEGINLAGKGYKTISSSNSIIFISSAHHKNDNDNDNDNENNDNDNSSNSNSMYYTYHSYSSGDDFNNNINIINNSNNNSYYDKNYSNYSESDSDDFSFGEKHGARFNSRKKNQSCPAMEPVIDRKLSNGKKNNKNCLIQ